MTIAKRYFFLLLSLCLSVTFSGCAHKQRDTKTQDPIESVNMGDIGHQEPLISANSKDITAPATLTDDGRLAPLAAGNTNSNLAGYSNISSDDEWLYYSPNHLYYDVGYTGEVFYKLKHNGSESVLLSYDNASCINIYDEWIFFIGRKAMPDEYLGYFEPQGIFKMKKDGSKRACILKEKDVRSMIVVDGLVYFLNSSGHLSRMKPDGSQITVLDERDNFQALQYDNGYLYYCHDNGLSRILLAAETMEPEVAVASINTYIIDDGWIYYNDDEGLKRISFDGVQSQLVLQTQSWYNGFVIADGFIYTIEEVSDNPDEFNYYLWKIDIDKIGAKIPQVSRIDVKWCPEDAYYYLYVYIVGAANGYLYYEQYEGGDLSHLQRMRYDGTGNEGVEPMFYNANHN